MQACHSNFFETAWLVLVETYVHTGTNHFYCPAENGLGEGAKVLGPYDLCKGRESTIFDNGEPNKLLAHMTMAAVCS